MTIQRQLEIRIPLILKRTPSIELEQVLALFPQELESEVMEVLSNHLGA